MTLYRLITGFVRRHWRAYAASAAMLTVIAVLTVWLPRHIGQMVDGLVAQRLLGPALWREIGWLLAAGVCIYFLRVAWRQVLYAAAYRMGMELRNQLYRQFALQGPRFYQRHRTGDLMALATNDVDAVEMAAGEALLAGFDGTLTLVLVVATMTLGVDWRLAAVVLLPFPLMAWSFWWISRHVHEASREALASFGALNDQVQESLSGVRTLRALGLEGRNSSLFAALSRQAADTSLKAQRWEAAYEPAVGLTLTAATVLALGYGGLLVWRQQISVGQLTSFSLYLGQLIWPMFAAGWVLALLERGRAAWGRLQPVLAEAPAVDDQGTLAHVRPGPLQARGLRFHYPEAANANANASANANTTTATTTGAHTTAGPAGAPALDDLSFTLPAGGTLGLVGPTGAGKSTLLKLLMRQWTPQRGHIAWGGVALADYRLAALREGIAWVAQEPFLFSATVAENIALGRPEASRAQIEAVARLAAVHDDIARLPLGYDTPVGERGITLSGGQRQRLAIARALLVEAPLLLLDDALSAVDTETESRILAALRAARLGPPASSANPADTDNPANAGAGGAGGATRSTLIVSHRLSTLQDADEILVLRHGRITERGSHAQLLALGGWYATQWRVQQLEASLEADDGDGDAARISDVTPSTAHTHHHPLNASNPPGPPSPAAPGGPDGHA
ncbi:ABC transporter ATP-binding protein [Aquabacterium sp. OR-4]|uniref:ABC transporter ATP-binding protein n=1 Tax=Aquabacterium sp. OR-4 TaxID=2978127 RepID=UPI0021B1EC4A|nr:ABC transporter transmembrane domain-containing protein [Aquabacterium sp. OR-4]MDT7836328.1 ABC transporter transmembrane domain-containing protein [Aquabacterium sp. OR-4]